MFSRYLGNLICVEGIVTRVSLVRPKVVRSVHYCPATKKVMERKYTDLTSFEAFPTSAVYPTKVFFFVNGISFLQFNVRYTLDLLVVFSHYRLCLLPLTKNP